MNDFIEKINGKIYNIEQAKQLFIDYTYRHKGYISERFLQSSVKIYDGSLPNYGNAHASTNIEQNIIRMVRGKNSIITFFHECKHLSGAWKDSREIWHSDWEYENDYASLAHFTNQECTEFFINRGRKGITMGEARAELYASKIFWELCNNSPQSFEYTAKNRKIYDEEIIWLKKICLVLGINEDLLLSWKSEDNYGRNKLNSLFNRLTESPDFWTKLEYRMDYASTLKYFNITHPELRTNQTTINNVQICKRTVNKILEKYLEHDIQKKYYLSFGCSENEFEQIYNKKIKNFQSLNNYLYSNNDYR